jgi:GNAT superfamily N-acetyltransferase
MAASDSTVRPLQPQDIAIAAELSAEAGWNQTEDDWRMLLRLNPENCFGIEADGRLVSTATLACYGRQLGWIGMVLTNGAYRRRGFARSLLLHAIERADRLGIESLKLDATDQGQPLYESLGFRVEQPVERWWRARQPGLQPLDLFPLLTRGATVPLLGAPRVSKGTAPCLEQNPGASGAGIQTDMFLSDEVEAYGADRSELLRALAEHGRVQTHSNGFCFSRSGRRANYIGPCISRNVDFARRSIQSCAAAESYWDLLPQNQLARDLAIELGFTPQRRLVRMVRGQDLRGREDWIYAIAGFELG